MKNYKQKTEDQELIIALLGKNKFLMLNLELVRALGPNAACYLTYLLDKAEFLLKSQQIKTLEEGFYVLRRDLFRTLNLTAYHQRKIEDQLKELKILEVEEMRYNGDTWNQYYINIVYIFELLESNKQEPNTFILEGKGVKSFNPPPQKF
jgi:hypothetical protein